MCNYQKGNFYNLNNKSVFTTYKTELNDNMESEHSSELRISTFEQIIDKWIFLKDICNLNISSQMYEKIICKVDYLKKLFSSCFEIKEISFGNSNKRNIIFRLILVAIKEGEILENEYFKNKFKVVSSNNKHSNQFSLISLFKEVPVTINNVEILNTIDKSFEITISNTLILYISF